MGELVKVAWIALWCSIENSAQKQLFPAEATESHQRTSERQRESTLERATLGSSIVMKVLLT